MQTYVYRSSRKAGLYVYLAEKDGLDRLPAPVLAQLGCPEFALSFELDEQRNLGQESAAEVLANLRKQGFHVQMPRDIEPVLEGITQQVEQRSAKERRGD